ncbi:MAG: adenylate kinase [Clostridia bacterium]|nr:adenylate kinase [Clostridia bacterium]
MSEEKTVKLIFLGAPGAGKGTQAELTAEKYKIPTISTGAILREAIAAGTELGKTAAGYVESGALVPDDLIVGLVSERISRPDCKNGFILDGFPRTIAQAKALDESGTEISVVIDIDVPDGKIIDRMAGRRVCASCGATFHVVHNPTGDGIHCDRCGGELTRRRDDDPEIVRQRLRTYHSETEPLVGYYEAKGTLKRIDGDGKVEDITAAVFEVVDDYLGSET